MIEEQKFQPTVDAENMADFANQLRAKMNKDLVPKSKGEDKSDLKKK